MRYYIEFIKGGKSYRVFESRVDPTALQEHAQKIMEEWFPEGSLVPRPDVPNEIQILNADTGDVLWKWTIGDEYRARRGGAQNASRP